MTHSTTTTVPGQRRKLSPEFKQQLLAEREDINKFKAIIAKDKAVIAQKTTVYKQVKDPKIKQDLIAKKLTLKEKYLQLKKMQVQFCKDQHSNGTITSPKLSTQVKNYVMTFIGLDDDSYEKVMNQLRSILTINKEFIVTK